MPIRGRTLACGILLATAAACSETLTSPDPIELVPPAGDSVFVGRSIRIVTTSRQEPGAVVTGAPFAWKSSDTSIAVVDASGVVFGIGIGTVRISATLEGHTNSLFLRVVPARANLVTAMDVTTTGTGQVCAVEEHAGAAWCISATAPDTVPKLDPFLRPHPQFAILSASYSHVCGLDNEGAMFCTGSNVFGQLLTGQTNMQATTSFAPAAADLRFASVSVGGTSLRNGFTCAIERTASVVYCAGNNATGQTGKTPADTLGELPDSVFATVAGNFTALGVSAGRSHTCAISQDGGAYCWGANTQGVLGFAALPSFNFRATPSLIPGGHTFSRISAGSHACGITTDGAAYCWGTNAGGQHGVGAKDTDYHTTPLLVPLPSQATAIYAGNGFTCAIVGAGDLYCWGTLPVSAAFSARLGARVLRPVHFMKGLRFRSVTADARQICGATTGGDVVCM